MSHAGRFFCLFPLNMLFAKCSLCHMHVMVSAGCQQRGSRFLRRGLPGDGLRGPAWTAGKHKAWPSSQQRSGKGGNYNVMAGHYLPAEWDTATSPRWGSPSTQREQSPTWPQPSSLMHRGAKDGHEQAALGSAESRSWTKTSVSVSVQIPNQQNITAGQGTLGFLKSPSRVLSNRDRLNQWALQNFQVFMCNSWV